MPKEQLKRAMDLILMIIAAVALSPVLLLVAALIYKQMGRPILFSQMRPGRGARLFPLYKFRTMTFGRNPDGTLMSDAQRLTPLGRFLRATSLDELPELLNIVKGEMSIVGPRPLLIQYLSRYTPEQARRHEVKPGLTGWAQINGRNAINWDEKFRLDLWYVDNWSIGLDLKIIAMTVKQVLGRKGINHQGEITMPEFFPREATARETRPI